MSTGTRVSFRQASDHFHVEISVVSEFAEFGLFPTVEGGDGPAVEGEGLALLGTALSLHSALGINKEGIEVILALRGRIAGLQAEIDRLQGLMEGLRKGLDGEDPEDLGRRGLLIDFDD